MKRIFLNGQPTELFFTHNSDNENIFDWIREQVMFSGKNVFNLTEQHSCSVNCRTENSLTIRGDEDLKIVEILTVVPIL